jgi:hypothetical protein
LYLPTDALATFGKVSASLERPESYFTKFGNDGFATSYIGSLESSTNGSFAFKYSPLFLIVVWRSK